MKFPRFTIGGLMLVVLLVAANFAAVRAVDSSRSTAADWEEFTIIVLPMANLLFLACAWGLRRIRRIGAFFLGFLISGLLACGSVVFALLGERDWLLAYFRWTFYWFIPYAESMKNAESMPVVVAGNLLFYGFAAIDALSPQVAIAVAGGMIFKAIRIGFRRWNRNEPGKPSFPDEVAP